MKNFYCVLTALLLSVSAWAQTYEDVTGTYLTNADFGTGSATTVDVRGYANDKVDGDVSGLQPVSGWSIQTTSDGDATGGAIFGYGTSPQLKGNNVSAPATGPEGTNGQALGYFAVWGQSSYYYQTVTLPAGSYKITYDYYNQSGTGVPSTSYFGFIPNGGGTSYVVAPADLATTGSWQSKTVKFMLTAETAGMIAIGYQSSGGGSSVNPQLFVDRVVIEYTNIGEDITESKITNPSFEVDLNNPPTGWTVVGGGGDAGAKENSNGTYATTGCDGAHLFNIWSWNGTALPHELHQSITLDAGRYMLSALLASDAGNKVTLFAGGQYLNVVIDKAKGEFTEYAVYFNVESDGTSVDIGTLSNTSWYKCDDFHLFKLNDDVAGAVHFETTGSDWTVSGGTATLTDEKHFYIDKNDKYIVAKVSGIATGIGDNELTTLNGAAEGHYPTYTWTIGDDTYLVWEFASSRYSLWYTLGDNLNLDVEWNPYLDRNNNVANTQLDMATVFSFTASGSMSIEEIASYRTLPDDVQAARSYCDLNDLIDAATELNTRLDGESNIAAAITTAEGVAASTSQNAATYGNARDALLAAIRTGLPNAATEVDVTDIYIRNNSFESGWASYWTPNSGVTGNQNTVRKLEIWGRDGNYIYNQWNGDDIAGSLVQNLTNLAAGNYQVSAAVCGVNGQEVTVKIGDETVSASSFESNVDGKVITTGSQSVSDNQSIQIGVTTEHSWFRADNFRLTYLPSESDVDKTDLRRMILTAENLVELGEGNAAELNDLSSYIALANNESASASEVAAAVNALRGYIQSSYDNYNKDSRPTAATPGDGDFFLYNVATKSYLNFGSQWGTRAIANDYRGTAGTLLQLEHPTELESGRYTMKTNSIWGNETRYLVALTRDGVWIDGDPTHTTTKTTNEGVEDERVNTWAVMPWKFEEVPGLEGRNVYRLYRTSGDERDYGLPAGTLLKKVMSLDRDDIMISAIDADGALNELYSYWILVSKATRDAMLDEASIANPVNASYRINNPDLEGYDNAQLGATWTLSSMNIMGAVSATTDNGDRVVENYNSESASISQTVTVPKAGLYMLKVNGFYRPGDGGGRGQLPDEANKTNKYAQSKSASDLQHKGLVTMNPYLYANGQSVPLMSVHTGDNSSFLELGTIKTDKQGVSGYITNADFVRYGVTYYNYGHVPNQPQTGNERFRYYYDEDPENYVDGDDTGLYSDNTLLVYVPSDDSEITIGVKKDAKMANDWTLFDHFNLWYLGTSGSADLASAYNTYRKAAIDAKTYLFDTYHHTELRDTAYTKHLDANGFDLAGTYGEANDAWSAGDPKGTVVFSKWLQDELEAADEAVSTALETGNAAAISAAATKLDYNVAVAELAYNMAEFYFFSRGVQNFYAAAKDGGSTVIDASVNKSELMSTNQVDADLAYLQEIDAQVINTLKQAMGISGVDASKVLTKDAVLTLNAAIKTTYPDPSTLSLENITESTNPKRDEILPRAINVVRALNPSQRSEFDLTFMLPRADVVGLEQWDWLPIYEWRTDDDPGAYPYNYDVHTGNNKYQGHDAYFAEKYRGTGDGMDRQKWVIYQALDLPIGLYRFSAATFARHGGEDSEVPATNAYVAIYLSDSESAGGASPAILRPEASPRRKAATDYDDGLKENATLLNNIQLEDRSAFYEVTTDDVDGETNLSEMKMGMYISDDADSNFASWIGMSQMRLYKIPQALISEDRVYRIGMSADAHGDGYDDADPTDNDKNYYPESADSEHADEVALNPYLFNFSEVAQITGVKRTFKKGTWQTLAFPFDMSRQEFLDMLGITDVVINQFTGSRVRHYEDWTTGHPEDPLGARVDLYFERETGDAQDSIRAHVPCLVYIPETETLVTPTWEAGTWYKPGPVKIVKATEASYWPDEADFDPYNGTDGVYMAEFSFDACYAGVNVGLKYAADGTSTATNDGLGSYLPETSYYISGNEFKYVPRKDDWDALFPDKAGKYNPVRSKGLRGYFTYHGASQQVKAGNIASWTYEFETDNGTDKIELNNFGQVIGRHINGRDVTGVYNVNGQLVRKDGSSLEGLGKGVYIVNGNKVIIK